MKEDVDCSIVVVVLVASLDWGCLGVCTVYIYLIICTVLLL